jgi:two-component sensor histidine kinase/sensor domain CHASE-containing protein
MRRRILLAIGGTLLVMLIIISLSSSALLRDSYAGLERRYIQRNMQRIFADIALQASELGHTVQNYAASSGMYQYVRHPTPTYTEGNFTPESVENLDLQVVIVLDNSGRAIYSRAFGVGADRPELAERLSEWIGRHPSHARFTDKTGKADGIIGLPQGLLIFSSRPILTASQSLPPAGTVVMGRMFDADEVRLLEDRLLVTVTVYPLVGSAIPDSVRRIQPQLTQENPQYIDTSKSSVASVYSLLKDIDGQPVAIVQMDSLRDIRQQGERTVRFFFIWLYFIGAGFLAVVILTIERTVLSRLMHLGRSVLAIGTGGDPTKRIAIAGKDQIAYLGAAINGMLDAQAKATDELRASERRTEAFLDAMPDVIFRVTRDGNILDARSPQRLPLLEAANDLVGQDAEMILPLYSFLSPELYDKSASATQAALDTGLPQMLAFHVDTESGRRWYEERFVASSEEEVIVLVREVTDLKQAEEARRKEVLLKEIHHRVKNNLQVISSLLALQASATQDSHTRGLLKESRNRVHSMALIHEKLYQSSDERGASFGAYVRDLAAHLRHSYAGNSESVTMQIDVEEITLDMDVLVPCGLIINELLSNALKYAFPEGRLGTISIKMRRDGSKGSRTLVLTVSDDGVGLPAGMDVHAPRTLGLRIVNTLVGQLHGTLVVGRGPGAVFTLHFPQA